jgi:transketolase
VRGDGTGPLADKWRAFGWRIEEINGHDYDDILGFLGWSRRSEGQPALAVAHTVKGHGVSFMEGSQEYHTRALTLEETEPRWRNWTRKIKQKVRNDVTWVE